MTQAEQRKKEARAEAIWKQMEAIPTLLDGTLMTKRNRVKRKDGSIHVAPEHCMFQYGGADGKRQWKRIPRNAKAVVERLVRAGQRYRALEREYRTLLTELALADDSKKNDCPGCCGRRSSISAPCCASSTRVPPTRRASRSH